LDIYLIRHTQVNVGSGICYGQSDVGLAESFSDEFQRIQTHLPTLPDNTVIISSPLQRCLQLAHKLNDRHFPLMTEQRIIELSFGDWEMQKWEEIDQTLLNTWMAGYVDIAPPNGESFQTLFNRCQVFWDEILTQPYHTLIVITHLGVIRASLAYILDLPLKKSFCLQNDYGAINHLKYHTHENQSWITIEYLNH
jgi:alpha-ribazole phosphatase